MNRKHSALIRKELDWYFNIFPARVGISAMDPSACVVTSVRSGYTDAQIEAITRSLPVRKALASCSNREKKILQLGMTVKCWRGPAHYEIENVFGELAGIVIGFRLEGTDIQKRARARVMLEKAIRSFGRHFRYVQN
jgi:hypothetical protein